MLGFAAKFERYSQLDEIIEKAKSWEIDIYSELKVHSEKLSSLIEDSSLENFGDEVKHKIQFISDQMTLLSTEPTGRRYKPETVRDSLDLFLRSRNCYSAARNIITLPNPKMLKSYFGEFGSSGSIQECSATVKSVFSNLSGMQLYCKVLIDEIHIKPSIRYRGNHIIGNSVDQPQKPARTILALMVCCMMGGPSFVARLISIYTIGHEFLFDQTKQLLEIIHDCGGFVFLVMTDNLRCNQTTFTDFHDKYGTVNEWSVNHPIPNSHFDILFVLFDPTHLLKNVRNNWVTEKTQILLFPDPDSGKLVEARWKDLIALYEEERDSTIKESKLDYPTLYPNNFEKQKLRLAYNVFNEKTTSALRLLGKFETSSFLESVTRLWNMLNIKQPRAGEKLNDKDRMKFTDSDDPRLKFIENMAKSFQEMNTAKTCHSQRIKCLTRDTSKALFITLNGIADIIRLMLNKGAKYVLPGEFQSDRLEAEFGIYRQQSGGNYYISVDQVMSSLHIQRLKLFKKLSIEPTGVHKKELCCEKPLGDDELECLDKCFEASSKLSHIERSTLYYICGYVSHKEGLDSTNNISLINEKASEFTSMVSRGKLAHPSDELFDLSQYLFSYYKSVPDKCCAKRLVKAFQEICEVAFLDFELSVLQRFANSFSKGFALHSSDTIKIGKRASKDKHSSIKEGRLRYY